LFKGIFSLSGKRCRDWGAIAAQQECKNAMISRITKRYFSTLDFTQIFEKTFHQSAYFTTTFLVFLG